MTTQIEAVQHVESRRVIRRSAGAEERDPVRFARRRRRIDTLLRFGVPVALLIVWQAIIELGLLDRTFWPAPTDIIGEFGTTLSSGQLAEATVNTLSRTLAGFVAGVVLGVVGGLILGMIRMVRVALDPVISALYTVPKLAILPLLLLLFGLGDTPKIILVAAGVFFIVIISTTAAIIAVNDGYLEPARSFGASRWQVFRHVLGPAILPDVFVSLRIAAGQAVLLMIGIEFVQGQQGLGFLIWNSWQIFLTERMYVGIITVAVLGVVFQGLVKWTGRRVCPWATTRD